jgi:hypothetical protein
VLFFQDGGQRIVCTHAFSKPETTPRPEVEHARGLREQYFAAKVREGLEVEEETS